MKRKTTQVLGKEVAYWEGGDASGQTLLMLHGFRGTHEGLSDVAAELTNYHLILPDLPGYGGSEPLDQPHTLINYASWLDAFVGALGLESYVSWSHSYSSSIALIQAAEGRHKPRAIVSVSLAVLRGGAGSWLMTTYYRAGRVLPSPLRQRWIANRTLDHLSARILLKTVTPERRRELTRQSDRNLPNLNPDVVTEGYFSALTTKLDSYARQARMPALFLAGARDIIVPLSSLERLVKLVPRGEIIVMPDQGHLAPTERPAYTAQLTKDWLATLG